MLRTGSTKLETLRNWGVSTYKCTKQILYEKLGKSSRTVDTGEISTSVNMLVILNIWLGTLYYLNNMLILLHMATPYLTIPI